MRYLIEEEIKEWVIFTRVWCILRIDPSSRHTLRQPENNKNENNKKKIEKTGKKKKKNNKTVHKTEHNRRKCDILYCACVPQLC